MPRSMTGIDPDTNLSIQMLREAAQTLPEAMFLLA